MQSIIFTEIGALFAMKPKAGGVSKEAVKEMLKGVSKKLDISEYSVDIARGLEKLKGKDRLDYNSLKNTPDFASKDFVKGQMRGGGNVVKYSDLSDQTDGAKKVFTVPINKRIIWVGGTDAPGGQYRQTVDFTASLATLTLTSEVIAPTADATLHIIYIE